MKGTGKGGVAGGPGGKISYRGIDIPLGRVEGYGVDIKLTDCRADVRGLWIRGESLSTRVSGVVRMAVPAERSTLDLKLELVPSGSLAHQFEGMPYLRPFRRSATYYTAAIKGTPGSPLILPR